MLALAHTCIPAHACIHTHLLHIIPQPRFFMGPRLVSGISAHVMFVIENILIYNSQTLQSATVHFRTAVKSSCALSQLLTLEHIVEDNVSIVIFCCWSLHLNTYWGYLKFSQGFALPRRWRVYSNAKYLTKVQYWNISSQLYWWEVCLAIFYYWVTLNCSGSP